MVFVWRSSWPRLFPAANLSPKRLEVAALVSAEFGTVALSSELAGQSADSDVEASESNLKEDREEYDFY